MILPPLVFPGERFWESGINLNGERDRAKLSDP
jgi:hypothetical protein